MGKVERDPRDEQTMMFIKQFHDSGVRFPFFDVQACDPFSVNVEDVFDRTLEEL